MCYIQSTNPTKFYPQTFVPSRLVETARIRLNQVTHTTH